MQIRKGLTTHYRNLGVRGVLATAAYRVLGRPTEITAHPPGIRAPVHLRVRTTDEEVYSDILLGGQYAFELPFLPKTIIDAGANIGMASIYFIHRYPEAKIIAVEPETSNFAVLCRNVKPYPAIIPVHAALWNRDGQISISAPDPATGAFGEWGFVAHEGLGVEVVRAITMRTLVEEMHMPSVDLLKVDIEGAEKEVFSGCDWMRNIRCLMIELHDRFKPGCSEAVNSVTQAFTRFERDDATVFIRN